MSKVTRTPVWRQRRMTDEQRAAFDRLRWYAPGPAERARLKSLLGWKRTREETVALARELLARGRVFVGVANELGVDPRYLRRLLKDETPENVPRNPSVHAAKVAPTGNGKVISHPRASGAAYPLCGSCPECLAITLRRLA